jgi:hypothetical protein
MTFFLVHMFNILAQQKTPYPFFRPDHHDHFLGEEPEGYGIISCDANQSNIKMHCAHFYSDCNFTPMAVWLDLVPDATGWSLVDTERLHELVYGMYHPRTQYPSVTYFSRNSNRLRAIKALFPHNNITRNGPTSVCRLHLSTGTASTENPLFFAEGSLVTHSSLGDSKSIRAAAERNRQFHIHGSEAFSAAKIYQHVIARKILPWINILCLFIDTVAELQSARQLLEI